jgi:hypothetical protein
MLEFVIAKCEAQCLALQSCLDDTNVHDTRGLEISTLSSSRWMLTVPARVRCVLRFGYLGKWSPCAYESLSTKGEDFYPHTLLYDSNFTLT